LRKQTDDKLPKLSAFFCFGKFAKFSLLSIIISLQHRQKRFLRDFYATDLLHSFFALFLLFEEFAFSGNVAAVAFCGYVFSVCFYRASSDNFASDCRLNCYYKLLSRN
jgi:Ca2+/Na+ antiporter